MRVVIPVFGMMSVNLFFVLSAIIGYQYMGIEDSRVYVVYTVFIAVMNILLIVNYLLVEKRKIIYTDILILAIPFIFIFFYLIGILINTSPNFAETRWFIFFLLWSVPAIYSAFYICRENKEQDMVKYIELLMIVFTLGVLSAIVFPFLSGIRSTEIGGVNYQTASYISAIAYGLSMYFYFFGQNHDRFGFTNSKIYRPFLIVMIIINLIGVLLPGGRGAFVLLVLYSIYCITSSLGEKKIKYVFRLIFLVTLLIFMFFILLDNSDFLSGYNRATAFLSSKTGIDWGGTSGRDKVYGNTIALIMEKPLLGYGIFGYWRVAPNPHNLFLELLLAGGIFYAFTFLILLAFILIKLFRMIKYDVRNRIWLIIFLYPITMLMFSGSYLVLSEFWFIISLIISYKKTQKVIFY